MDPVRRWEQLARSAAAAWSTRAGVEIPPGLVLAMIDKESSGDPWASGDAGERGLMQVMPATALTLARSPARLYEPRYNIETGVQYLAQQLRRYAGDAVRAVSAYNAGTATTRNLDAYVTPVLDRWARLYRDVAAGSPAPWLPGAIVLAAAVLMLTGNPNRPRKEQHQ